MSFQRELLLSGCLTALALSLACGSGGSSANLASTPSAVTNIAIVDAPSDTWSTISVQVTSVTLRNASDHTQTVVFTGAETVNLVDLDSLSDLLASAQVPIGTYDQATVVVNTDPSTITLIPAGGGSAVASDQITVVGNGSLTVDLTDNGAIPATVVQAAPSGTSNAVQIDFDLAHPLFINQTPSGNVVINFQVKHHDNPVGMSLIQLHRHQGSLTGTSGTAAAGSLAVTTLASQALTFATDGNTLFWDVDSGTAVAGTFAGLANQDAVMVASRLQDDGSLYAVRVWYCSAGNAANLPKYLPEGHVDSVNTGTGIMTVDNADGNPRKIQVTGATTFTYQGSTQLGTGTSFLADVQHGFKVSIQVVNPLAAPLVATSVNIERAVDSGFIDSSTTATTLTYGQAALANFRHYPYGANFSWWDYEQPTTASTNVTSFVSALAGAGTTRVNGTSDLVWGGAAWDANTAILMPNPLPRATIVTPYSAASGTMVISYLDPLTNAVANQTITLTSTGTTQTVVQKLVPQGGKIIDVSLDPASDWAADLTTGASAVWVNEVPQANALNAYSVVVLEQQAAE